MFQGVIFCQLSFLLASGVYLSSEDATEANDDQDVKDSWSHDSSHTNVSFCDKHP